MHRKRDSENGCLLSIIKVPFFNAHLMVDQIDLQLTLGLDRRSSQWPFSITN